MREQFFQNGDGIQCCNISVSFSADNHDIEVSNAIDNENVKRNVIVLGAHYDTVPESSGFDDNTSGVVTLLLLAQWLARFGSGSDFQIVIVWFDSEETGCEGSEHWCKDSREFAQIRNRVKYMVNLDMIGRIKRTRSVRAIASRPHSIWKTKLSRLKFEYPITVLDEKEEKGITDYDSFKAHGIPFVSFSTGTMKENHTRFDTSDKIDVTGLAMFSLFLYRFVVSNL